jgi:hypothetical protein
LTEREWQRLENTMRFIVEQQAKFEANFAAADKRFARVEGRLEQADRRMDRMERYADRVIKAGERRMARADAEIIGLRETLKSFLEAMRRSEGNGRHKS